MEHALFFIFSFLEFSAGLAFILALFRFDFLQYRTHIMYTAFLLTEISYLLRMGFDLKPVSIIIQMAALIVMIVLLYQLPLFSAVIIGSVGYMLFGLVQMVIIVVASLMTGLSLTDIYDSNMSHIGHAFQTLTTASGFLLAWAFRKWKIGFNFLPRKKTVQFDLDTENVLIFSIMAVAVLTILTYSIYMFDKLTTTIVLMVLLIMQIVLLIYLANRKVNRND